MVDGPLDRSTVKPWRRCLLRSGRGEPGRHPTVGRRRGHTSGCGASLAQIGQILGRTGPPLDSSDEIPLRRKDDVCRQDADAILLTGVREILGVDFYGDKTGLQSSHNLRPAKDFLFHLFARLTPVGREVDQHHPVRLQSHALGGLQVHLPANDVLSRGRTNKPAAHDRRPPCPQRCSHGRRPRRKDVRVSRRSAKAASFLSEVAASQIV